MLLEHYVILFAPQIRVINLVLDLPLEVKDEEGKNFKKKKEREKKVGRIFHHHPELLD